MTTNDQLIEHFVDTIDKLVKENKELKKEIEVLKNGY